jgi:hypothetical protein
MENFIVFNTPIKKLKGYNIRLMHSHKGFGFSLKASFDEAWSEALYDYKTRDEAINAIHTRIYEEALSKEPAVIVEI